MVIVGFVIVAAFIDNETAMKSNKNMDLKVTFFMNVFFLDWVFKNFVQNIDTNILVIFMCRFYTKKNITTILLLRL